MGRGWWHASLTQPPSPLAINLYAAAFARLTVSQFPKRSVLHKTISTIRPQTWEAINRHLLKAAVADRIETGRVIRLDSTVTFSPIHQPTDNSLLWDAMRLMVRLLRCAQTLPGAPRMHWRNRSRQAEADDIQ